MNTVDKLGISIIMAIICLAIIVGSVAIIESPTKTSTSTVYSYIGSTTTITQNLTSTSTNIHISTIECKLLINGTNGGYHGSLPNGTLWVSIDGSLYYGKQILNGTYAYNRPPSGTNVIHWWIINNC